MGLAKDENSRYQQLAALPADHFKTEFVVDSAVRWTRLPQPPAVV